MTVESREVAVDGEFRVVRPLVSVEEATSQWRNYQALSAALLSPSDYQTYSDRGKPRQFKKKSAWRKFATYYGFNLELRDSRVGHRHDKATCVRFLIPDEKECGCPTQYSRMVVRATAPNGRYVDGVGVCAIGEKNRVFTKPDHEIPATAYTRAANRAIADLMGVGEDSAEEIRGTEEVKGLPQEDREAIKAAWKDATPERRERGLASLREWGFAGESVAAVFTDFNRRGGEEAVNDLVTILGGFTERFDPDEPPVQPQLMEEEKG